MTKRSDIARLKDIKQAIDTIERHPLYSRGRAAYDEDEYYRAAIYLHVERLCEAATALIREHAYDKKYPEIPWEEIAGMRIILAHQYWNIDDDIIWTVVEEDLPMLKAKVEFWLKERES